MSDILSAICPLRVQKLSKKQRKRIFVCCSKMPYFRAFLHISTSYEKCTEIFTSRDIIYLMTDILLEDTAFDGQSITVYDMAMGTSQMLSCMEERIHALDSESEVTCFGQEFNPSTFAIAKADMMIRGGNPDNMRFGDTLSDDKFNGFKFNFIISNPPFGIDWKREQKAVEKEAALGERGRFSAGLPKISDGQQLFVMNGLSIHWHKA